MRVVHQGRGGYIEIEDRRYPIEMGEGGRFSIHFSQPPRRRTAEADLAALEALVQQFPEKWALERRRRPPKKDL